MKIALVAACDRNNFGDVLLPIMLEDFIKKYSEIDFDFEYFALSAADLSNVGGKKTKPISLINSDINIIILTGGEVLCSHYLNMYLNLQTSRFKIIFLKVLSKISHVLADGICKCLLKGKTPLPWIVDPDSRQIVIYNAVGGIGLDKMRENHKIEIKKLVNKCSFFSVRDKKTYSEINKMGVNCELIPDTAVLMSDFYTDEFLQSHCSAEVKNIISELDTYFVLQVNKKYGKYLIDSISCVIDRLNNAGLKCVLLPIGRAQGHEDIIPLSKIARKAKNSILIEQNNIYDVIYIIKNSVLYTGTSLHGAITAISYDIPHVALTSEAVKLINFLETWNTTKKTYFKDFDDMYNYIVNLQCNYDCICDNKKVKSTAKDYLKRMLNGIEDYDNKNKN